ncbi:MAG: glycosyltransferase [Acidobacteria bacterium]|nr:glycosyltransferase [Acidobacteriota bacterium]
MRVVHLMASPFYGGPERQMLGLASHLPSGVESIYLSFAEHGLAQRFIDEAQSQGREAKLLACNTPRIAACIREVAGELRRLNADLVCCSGYKPDIIGWRAARLAGIPAVSVSHGWTAVTWKVRAYESLDRLVLRWMDAVVCVSKAQAGKVRRAGVPDEKIVVIPNAIDEGAFVEPDARCRAEMEAWFAPPPRWLVASAGRLSPEKGFGVFIDAAALVAERRPGTCFVLFGEGPLRPALEQRVRDRGLEGRFVMAGFRDDLRRFLPNLDVAVMSSFTEGLPVFLLEAAAAQVPVVATSVGGVPEVIDEGRTGHLVPAGDARGLADGIVSLADNPAQRDAMGQAARARARTQFSFPAMGRAYHDLFRRVARPRRPS